MRTTAMLLMLAGAWALLPACGGTTVSDVVAEPPATSACGADPCGACAAGTTNSDSCSADGKWACSCIPIAQCGAAPTCAIDENQFASAALCSQSGATSCRSQSICGSTIWCGKRRTGPCDSPSDGCNGIWPASATSFTATNEGGGFAPTPPPGSQCQLSEAHYTYTRATRTLSWQVCDTNVSPYAVRSSSRALTTSESADVESAMGGLTLAKNENGCGADKPLIWVSVTTPTGTKKYLDSFYACAQQGTYVDHIDGVLSALRAIAK